MNSSSLDLKNKDFVDTWLDAIDLGLKYKDIYSDHSMWQTYRDWYRGYFGNDDPRMTSNGAVVVNRVFPYIRSMIPRVYFRTPSIAVTPRRAEQVLHARVVEHVDNWLIYETKLKKQLKRSILDAALCGVGILKLGYDSEYGYLPLQALDENSSTITQASTKTGDLIEYNSGIAPGMPWALRVKPDEIITPYGYDDPDNFPWIAHMFIRPLEDCQEDQKYDKKNRKELKGGFSIPKDKAKAFAFMRENVHDNFVLLYEIRCKKTRKIIVIAENRLLMHEDDAMQIDGLPYEFIIFNEDPEHFWPISDVRMLAPQQRELNEIRTQAAMQRRLALLKFAYLKGSLTKENLDRLLSGDLESIGVGIEVNSDSISTSMQFMQPHNVTDELMREQQLTASDMRDTVGYSQNQMGEYVPFHNKTATEANIVDQGSNIRSDERRDIVADALTNILRKWNQMIFKYWDKPKVAEIAGEDGVNGWFEYTGAQLQGEYTLVINPETGTPVSRALRQKVAESMYQHFNNDPLIDQVGLRRLVLQQTDLIDPGYQNLIRVPQTQGQPQQPGEMPGMPGIPAAGQPVGQPGGQGSNAQGGQPNPAEMMQKLQAMKQGEDTHGLTKAEAQMRMAQSEEAHKGKMKMDGEKHNVQILSMIKKMQESREGKK